MKKKENEIQINDNRVYRLKEVAELAGQSVNTIRRRLEANRISRISAPNEDIRILGSELKRYLKIRT